MASEVYARIVFQSPLPALDREFEYMVPQALVSAVTVGCRVKVPFAGQTKDGFVVALVSEPEFSGKISPIREVVSSVPVLQPHVYQVLKSVAERQCCSVGELIDNAVPKRSVRVEKSFALPSKVDIEFPAGMRLATLVRPYFDTEQGSPSFVLKLRDLALKYLGTGRSVIVCVPDFRDLQRVAKVISHQISTEALVIQDSSEVGSKRYESFLRQLGGAPKIVLGTRTAIYSPIAKDSAIIIWDDGDQSHQDQQSPYLTTREIALMRQSLFGCPLHFLSHSRSAEVQRLVQIGYLEEDAIDPWRPQVAISEGRGLDATSFKIIKTGLETGAVLFQVASPGVARSLYCENCSERSKCNNCHGPLWLNAKGQVVCRWCGQLNLAFKCASCGGVKLKQGAAGATRWAEQLGKSFPGVQIREITADKPLETLSEKPSIVVCTAGIEPVVPSGYSAVVLVDCATQLSRDSLRAPEDALRGWLNSLAFMKSGGKAVAVGVSHEVAKALSLGQVIETAADFLTEREELGFPPARRVVSVTGALDILNRIGAELKTIHGLRILGIAEAKTSAAESDFRLVATFQYGIGSEVADELRKFQLTLGTKDIRTNSKSGRVLRPVTIKFDDPRVL